MGVIRGADFVTLANAMLGTTAVLSLITPLPLGLPEGDVFLLFVTLALVGDGLDGLVARRFGMSRVGRMLDSLSDGITFGLAPAAFAVHRLDWRVLPAVLVFMACALWRLALFTTLTEEKRIFRGLPSPVAGIVVLAAALVPAGLLPVPRLGVLFGLTILMGVLMVSGVEYPKIRGPYQPMLVVFALVALAHLGVYFAWPRARGWVVLSGLAIGVAVVVAAPWFAARLGSDEAEAPSP